MRATGRPSSSPPSRSSSWDRNFPPTGSGRPPPPTLGFGSSRRRSARPARRKPRRCASSPRSGPGGPTSTPPSPRSTRRSARSRPASAHCKPRSIGSLLAAVELEGQAAQARVQLDAAKQKAADAAAALYRGENGGPMYGEVLDLDNVQDVFVGTKYLTHMSNLRRAEVESLAGLKQLIESLQQEANAQRDAVRSRAGTGARRTRPDRRPARRAAGATGRSGAGRGPGTRARGVDPIAEGQVQLASSPRSKRSRTP